jgi:hypothetical protein
VARVRSPVVALNTLANGGPALRQPQSAALWPFGYFTATTRDARRQQRRISCRSGEALFEHWLKIKNRAAPAVKREAGPRTAIKSSNKSAWPFDVGPGASLFRFKL